jgi:hypothetical protein
MLLWNCCIGVSFLVDEFGVPGSHLQDMQLIPKLGHSRSTASVSSSCMRHSVVVPQTLGQAQLIHDNAAATAAAAAVAVSAAAWTWCMACKHQLIPINTPC